MIVAGCREVTAESLRSECVRRVWGTARRTLWEDWMEREKWKDERRSERWARGVRADLGDVIGLAKDLGFAVSKRKSPAD